MDLSPDPNREPVDFYADNPERNGRYYVNISIAALAALVGLGAFAVTLWVFLGFAENDATFETLLPAFILCFGLGALAYVPALIIAGVAFASRLRPAAKSVLLILIGMIVPWVGFLVFLLMIGPMFGTEGASLWRYQIGLGVCLIFLFWAIIELSRRRS